MLGVAQTNAQTKIGQLNRQIQKDKNAGKSSKSTIRTVQKGLLANPTSWTDPTYSSSDYEWTFAVGNGQTATGVGPDRNTAINNAKASGALTDAVITQNRGNSAWGTQGNPVKTIPKYEDVHTQLVNILVNAGMNPNKANAWIATFMPGVARLPH
jgi:hypothetical protein